ncbi:hypothetical protein EDD53_2167 [Pacificibacter maritimus]|uniref:Uncharacterized protein n=1 Tax=Pacificibacter maritimus TaxID=762213 RepID=A0A3N4V0M9_9RHOB|nr:hypothetical protein [Pacificibacter maritimus]RPE66464.1 hypothetical protein EDD53_2167 [Pacificibacter maritimus]
MTIWEHEEQLLADWSYVFENWRLETLINLLAWECGQNGNDIAEIDASGWPNELRVWQDSYLSNLAHKDPRIFQIARLQLSKLFSDLATGQVEPCDIPQEAWTFSKRFIQTDVPSKRGRFGDRLARDILIWEIFRGAEDVGKWSEKCFAAVASGYNAFENTVNYESLGFNYSAALFARCLSDELNNHPTLLESADSVPSPDLITSVLKKGNGDFGWIKHGDLLSNSTLLGQ